MMTTAQRIAITHHCRLGGETCHPRFGRATATGSIIVTVNSGYE